MNTNTSLLSNSKNGTGEHQFTRDDVLKLLQHLDNETNKFGDELETRIEANDPDFIREKGVSDLKNSNFNRTDLGNAKRLVKLHGKDLHFCHDWAKWLIWSGYRWKIDHTNEVERLAKDTAKYIHAEASESNNNEERKALSKWANQSESDYRISAMLNLTKSEPGIPVTPDQLDANGWLLNVKNGTINLKNGEIYPHKREDLITKLANITYDHNATYYTFMKFLHEILDNESINFIQSAIGYSLTGDVSEQALFFLHGSGANGKSTLLNVIRNMLGDYAKFTDPELLTLKENCHPTGRADLMGVRLAITVETEEGKQLAETFVKQITGEEKMKARFMKQDFFEFNITSKIWLAANHKPVIRGTDYAIWRRIHLIPFNTTIPKKQQDKKLAEKLNKELSGILNWAILGCLNWQENGLEVPEEVASATQKYKNEMDTIGNFISEYCTENQKYKIKASTLYEEYKKWCGENGEVPLSTKFFGIKLAEKGLTKKREIAGFFYIGIGLKN